MATQKQTSKEYFRALNILHFAMLAGQVMFAAITLYLNLGQIFEADDSLKDIFLILVPILVLNGFITGHLIYKSRLKKLSADNNLVSKMGNYRSAMIIRLALLEGASLFAIIVYLLTADIVFIVMAGVVMAYFAVLRPTPYKIAEDLMLNSTEKARIENPNEVIAEIVAK